MKHALTFYNNKKVVVTGGAGFIGSHLVDALVAQGAHVTVIDNLSTGSLDNLLQVLPNITFIQEDITNLTACLEATQDHELIFHCAAIASVPASWEDPALCHTVNVTGTVNMLESARKNSIGRLIFSSSSAVYGAHSGICSEETTPCAPTSPYGFSKLLGEFYGKQYSLLHGVDTVLLRYFNVFGDRQNDSGPYAGVVAAFKRKMAQNIPVTMHGDGLQTRDFIPVEDVVQANLLLGALPREHLSKSAYNIGRGSAISLLGLFEHLKKDFPEYTHAPEFLPARPGDIKHSVADCSKFKKVVQFYY